jgi:D-hexose-6-phosphate mutarotase
MEHHLPETPSRSATSVSVEFDEKAPGLTVLVIDSELASATVSLFGGQVLTWQPRHAHKPVLWLSTLAHFDAKTAIRGGAPVCWPWFGPHPYQPVPAHGYARTSPWRLDRLEARADSSMEVVLSLKPAEHVGGRVPLNLSQTIVIGRSLDISLTTRNFGTAEVSYSEGLHTYFNVSDIADVQVSGLNGREYVDLTTQNARRIQTGPVRFEGETGRLFVNTLDTCTLEDPGFKRRIRVEKSNSMCTAIWNPAHEVAAKMGDLGADHWRTMACVETANALENRLTLDPGAEHTMGTRYTVEAWST